MTHTRLLGRSCAAVVGVLVVEFVVSVYVVAYNFCPAGWLLRESNAALFAIAFVPITLQVNQGFSFWGVVFVQRCKP